MKPSDIRPCDTMTLPIPGHGEWKRATHSEPSTIRRCQRCGERISQGTRCDECKADVAKWVRDFTRARIGAKRCREGQIRPT